MSRINVEYKARFGESHSKAPSSETARIPADRKPPVSSVACLLALAHYTSGWSRTVRSRTTPKRRGRWDKALSKWLHEKKYLSELDLLLYCIQSFGSINDTLSCAIESVAGNRTIQRNTSYPTR